MATAPDTTASDPALPPGHPATGATSPSDAPANPHGVAPHGQGSEAGIGLNPDESAPDPSLPKGSVVATVVDASGAPLTGIDVKLGKMFQSIAEGDKRDFETRKSDATGRVSFSNLPTDTNFSYRVSVKQGDAEYASAPFQLGRDQGQRVLLHVYASTPDIKQTRVALRGLVYVQPREDVFQFEVWLQVFNVSQISWVPRDVSMALPAGSKAFSSEESMADTRVEADGDERARLVGTFSPGQHDVRFSFQVPNEQRESASFQLSLPPNMGEFRVITEARKGMTLDVRGFPSVQTSTGMQGERVLVTQKRGDDLSNVHFQIAGLPTRGSAPWFAVMVAAAVAASGVYSARNSAEPRQRRRRLRGDLREARRVILDELEALEAALARGAIGPKSYEHTRRTLLNALARVLEGPAPGRS